MFKFIEVSQSEIRAEKVEAAVRMLAYSCKQLEIPAPELNWFAPAENPFNFKAVSKFKHSSNILGLADHRGLLHHGGTIWVRADLPAKETAEIVAHETLHIMQFYTLGLKYYGVVDTEKLADDFAEAVAAESYLKDDESYLAYLTGQDFSGGRFKNKELAEAWRKWSGRIARTAGARCFRRRT
mgnify:CR=1 FL=1